MHQQAVSTAVYVCSSTKNRKLQQCDAVNNVTEYFVVLACGGENFYKEKLSKTNIAICLPRQL